MGNNFSADSNCKALWRFENGALTTDSKGGNTLTATGSPASDTTNYKEGSGSLDLAVTAYYTRTDTDLDAGFPLKNGDANKKISVCLWMRPHALPVLFNFPVSKWDLATHASFAVSLRSTGNIRARISYDGTNVEDKASTATLTINQWYHVGITFQDSDKSYQMRIWGDTEAAVVENSSGTFTNSIFVSTGPLNVGSMGSTNYDGNLDEIVVFDDILTADEIDQIRAGTYGATVPVVGPFPTFRPDIA